MLPVTGRPNIPAYLKALYRRRFFIRAEARANAFSSTRNMLLGKIWIVLNPMLDALVYGIIFGFLLNTSRGIDNFIPFLVVGVTFFGFLSKAILSGAGLIRANRNVIKAFLFPRAALVLSTSLKNFYDSIPVLLITLIMIIVLPQGVWPTWKWFLVVPLFFLQTVFGLGLTFLTTYLTDLVPDLKAVINYLMRFVFYASGVFFSVEKLAEDHETVLTVLRANPFFQFLDMARDCLIYDSLPSFGQWMYLLFWTTFMLSIGFLLFWSREVKYARQ
ncbi:hypothetical protein BSR28_01980 [Boudabousia liubingyangii]|nr:hypothetical protein BSR28_01980 [Boudabousia liubingyangii]